MKTQTHDKFRLLFEHSSDAHFIMTESSITDCNRAAVDLLRASSKKDILCQHPATLSPERQPDGSLSIEKSIAMDSFARKNGYHRFEWHHRKMDGEVFPVHVTLNAIEIDGKPALIAVWHDLTEFKRAEDRLKQANEKMRKDLEAASAIQRGLLPISSPLFKGIRSSWIFNPYDELCGDMLNIFSLDEKHLGLYLLDVTGHGVAASLLSVTISHFLSPYSENSFVRSTNSQSAVPYASPAEVANKLNRQFTSNPDNLQLFTLIYGVLNIETGVFCYVCAGHPLPIIASKGEKPRLISGGNPGIGIARDIEYSELCLKLKPGDRLYLYSDGITEAKSPKRELLGHDRLLRFIEKSAKMPLAKSLDLITEETSAWCKPDVPEDDMTILACELTEG